MFLQLFFQLTQTDIMWLLPVDLCIGAYMYKMPKLHVRLHGEINVIGYSCTQSLTLDQQIPCFKFPKGIMGSLSFANRNRVVGPFQAGTPCCKVNELFYSKNSHSLEPFSTGARFGGSAKIRPPTGDNAKPGPLHPFAACATSIYTSHCDSQEHIGTHNRRISPQTVRCRLDVTRMFARRPYKGPILTRRHHQNRLA